MIIITDERCMGYATMGHPERPERIGRTLDRLRSQKELPIEWAEPVEISEAAILRAHARAHLKSVQKAVHDFDADTPAHPGIYDHALRSIGGGLRALQAAREGKSVFSLLRPPGHHATHDNAMGFCYLNSLAITVAEALATGTKKVGVFDFDVHHGNGTEDILRNQSDVVVHSIHQYPCYPGTGASHSGKNCFNYPVMPHTPPAEYRQVLAKALANLKEFGPELVAVSAGFDAYAHDPIAQETLEVEDFKWLGEQIAQLEVPTLHLLEGGYSSDLPELILAYLKGLEGK